MTIRICFFLLFFPLWSSAQFSWAQIGVNGLTCSACTRSVEMGIRKLSFVDSVSMNLENTQGKIVFKKGAKVELEEIAKAVIDAGFSLRSLYASIDVGTLKIKNNFCWGYENDSYHFVKVDEKVDLKGLVLLKFVGEKYMSKKEFKKWKMLCNDSCSPELQLLPRSNKYYVTLQ